MSNVVNKNREILIVVGKILEVKVESVINECRFGKYIAKIKNINEIKFDISENLGEQKYFYLFKGKSDLCRTKVQVIKVSTDDERIFDVLKLAFEKGYIAEVGFDIDNDSSNNDNSKNNNSNNDSGNNNNNNTCNIKPDGCYKVLYVNLRKPQEEI